MNKPKILMLIGLLALISHATAVSAHSITQTLGSNKSGRAATDVYIVSCASGTDHIYFQVNDELPVHPASISIQAYKDSFATPLSTDAKDGDALGSPGYTFKQGAGDYILLVDKSVSPKKGIEIYSAEVHCEDAAGGHTDESEPYMTQNQ